MSQQINLYESRLRPRRELGTGRNLGISALILLLMMTALSVWANRVAARKTEAAAQLQQQVSAQQEKLIALTKANAERRVSPALAAELERAKATLVERTEVMDALESGRQGSTSGFSAFLSGFARQTMPDLWLTGFRVARGGDDIEIRGRVLNPSGLPVYVQRLGREPVFQGRRFAGLEMQDKPQVEEGATPAAQPVQPVPQAVSGSAGKAPRFVEFVLRSGAVTGKDAAAAGGKTP